MPQADSTDTTTLPHTLPPQLAAQEQHRQVALADLRDMRKQAREEIDRLIAFLDASDLDPDLEEAGDLEPPLGWTDLEARFGAHAAPAGEDEPDTDAEPSLGFSNGGYLPENEPQDGPGFHTNANAGDDCEDEHCGAEPDVDREASLGWTDQINQTKPGWSANYLGTVDLEEGVGPVRKERPASRTGNRVLVGVEVLR